MGVQVPPRTLTGQASDLAFCLFTSLRWMPGAHQERTNPAREVGDPWPGSSRSSGPTAAHQRPFGGVLELVTGWSGVGRPAAMVVYRVGAWAVLPEAPHLARALARRQAGESNSGCRAPPALRRSARCLT